MAEHSHDGHTSGSGAAGRYIFWAFILIAAYFLVTEHRAHVVRYLPFLLLLACPLLHMFHGHGGHEGNDGGTNEPAKPRVGNDPASARHGDR